MEELQEELTQAEAEAELVLSDLMDQEVLEELEAMELLLQLLDHLLQEAEAVEHQLHQAQALAAQAVEEQVM